MPQRVINAWWIVVGVLGLAAAGALVLAGVDLARAARRGPRWKRRLLTAAISLLALLGVSVGPRQPAVAADAPAKGAEAVQPGLAQAAPWQRMTRVWAEAEEVAGGKRGAYPFDTAGKKKLLAELAACDKEVDALAKGKFVTAPEAGLLKKELARLTQGVQRKRPAELKMATCYKPAPPLTWPYYGLQRLEDRLELLGKLADSQIVHPLAAGKALAAVEADILSIEKSGYVDKLPAGPKKDQGAKTLASAKKLVGQIKKKLPGTTVGPQATGVKLQWQVVKDAWQFACPLAASGKSTTAQRKQAEQKLKDAKEAAEALATSKEITGPEAGLLLAEATTIWREIVKNPPTDCRVTCYDMAYNPPAMVSLTRLRQRLPLLQKLAASGKVRPTVVTRILPTVRRDLATLADPKLAKALGSQAADAKKTAAAVGKAVQTIEKLLPTQAAGAE